MEHLREIVGKIALHEGFKVFELKFELGSDLGFIGLLERCRITEGDRELSVFCKFLPKDKERNEKFNSFRLFEREVFVYQELLPEFEKLQLENGFETNDSIGFWSHPKCYYANYDERNPENSVIIMEDLTVEKFEVKDKFVPSDFEHTSRLFVELAKLHGLSFALKLKKPKVFEKFSQMRCSLCDLMVTDSMRHIAPRNCELICGIFKNDPEILQKLTALKDNIWGEIARALDAAASEPFSVICHGDVWINNVLYNPHHRTKLVDWQVTFCGSLGAELMYYLYCCVDKCVRERHQGELFELYYTTMRTMLAKFAIEISRVLPRDEFERQIRVYGVYAFGMANFAIPLLCKYPERLFDDANAPLSEEETRCVRDYERRMRDIILDMIDMRIL